MLRHTALCFALFATASLSLGLLGCAAPQDEVTASAGKLFEI
jgi:hypothetical protein